MDTRANKVTDWKLWGIEFSARFVLVLIAFLATLYMAAGNWDWYTNDLDGSVKQPVWANATVNWIIGLVWFTISAYVWNRHHDKHTDQIRIDLFYPIILILVFIMFTLFFEQRDLGAAKWAGVLAIISLGYILYEGFVADGIVAALLVVNFAILLYIVAQIWYLSKNELLESTVVCMTEPCATACPPACPPACPTECPTSYPTWYD